MSSIKVYLFYWTKLGMRTVFMLPVLISWLHVEALFNTFRWTIDAWFRIVDIFHLLTLMILDVSQLLCDF